MKNAPNISRSFGAFLCGARQIPQNSRYTSRSELPAKSRDRKKVSFGKGFFSKYIHLLEILEIPQSVENKGESEHILEIPEKREIFEILARDDSSEKTAFVMTRVSTPEKPRRSTNEFLRRAWTTSSQW